MREKIIVVGVGSTGSQVAKLAIERGMEIIGAFDINEAIAGNEFSEILGIKKKLNVSVSADLMKIKGLKADIALYLTSSRMKDIYPQILPAIEAGMNVITTSDEFAFPWSYPESISIDEAAKKRNVTVFGTGANPGFLVDVLPVVFSSACHQINQISVKRVADLGPYGGSVPKQFGIGLTKEVFERLHRAGKIGGHIASQGIVKYIANSVGFEIGKVTERIEPVIASTTRIGRYCKVNKGNIAGTLQIAYGKQAGKKSVIFEMNATVQPQAEGLEAGTYLAIEGKPSIQIAITSTEVREESVLITSARVVNSIPIVLSAKPGLLIQSDLPIGAGHAN